MNFLTYLFKIIKGNYGMKNKELTTRELLEEAVRRYKNKSTSSMVVSDTDDGSSVSSENDQSILPDEQLTKVSHSTENEQSSLTSDDVLAYACITQTECQPEVLETIQITPDGAVQHTQTVTYIAPIRFTGEFAQKFNDLPVEWQQYLCDLDAQISATETQMRQELDSKKWMDTLYQMHCGSEFSDKTESVQNWVEKMAYVEHLLEVEPHRALALLEQVYIKNTSPRIHQSGQAFPMDAYFRNRCQTEACNWLNRCLSETDAAGTDIYPHRKSVMPVMLSLLNARMASDIQEAYQQAVWMDKTIREKMIETLVCDKIKSKIAEARQAKAVAFAPSGKGAEIKESDEPKTTRELLEEAARRYKR